MYQCKPLDKPISLVNLKNLKAQIQFLFFSDTNSLSTRRVSEPKIHTKSTEILWQYEPPKLKRRKRKSYDIEANLSAKFSFD